MAQHSFTIQGCIFCRVCRQYFHFLNDEDLLSHYMSHIRFLELLIKDLDIKTVSEENTEVSSGD